MRQRVLALLGVLASPVVVSCGGEPDTLISTGAEVAQPAAEVELLDAKSAQSFLDESNPIVIDVRTQEEFDVGYIAGATLIDMSSPGFTDAISSLDRSATYFVYCRSGNRSASATKSMIDIGFTSVYELDGGILAWSAAGNPIES